MVGIGGRRLAQIEPVRPAEVARIGVAAGTRGAELFLKAFELAELGQERPGFQRVAVISVREQAHDAAAAADRGFESEHRLDGVGAGAHHLARRPALGIDGKAARHRASNVRPQLPQDRSRAVDGLDVPAQRQHIAPIAIGVEQRIQQAVVGARQRVLELGEPIVGGYRKIVGLVEHGRFSSPAVFAAFSLVRTLYPSGRAQNGRDEITPIPRACRICPSSGGTRPLRVSR